MSSLEAQRETLLRGAFAVQVLTGVNNMTMIEAVDQMVKTNNATLLQAAIKIKNSSDTTSHATALILAKGMGRILHSLPPTMESRDYFPTYIALSILTVVFIVLRIILRLRYFKKLRPDDYVAIFALGFALWGPINFAIEAAPYSGPHPKARPHVYMKSLAAIKKHFKMEIVTQIMFMLSSGAVKLVFLTFYYILLPSRGYRSTIIGVGVFLIIQKIAYIFPILFACGVYDRWNHLLNTKCINGTKFSLSGTIINIITEVVIFLIPLYAVWSLKKLPRRDKISITFMFASGALVIAFSIVRFIVSRSYFETIDPSRKAATLAIYGTVEIDLSLIISCFPAIYKSYLEWRNTRNKGNESEEEEQKGFPAAPPLPVKKPNDASFFRNKFGGHSILAATFRSHTTHNKKEGHESQDFEAQNVDRIEIQSSGKEKSTYEAEV